MFFCNLLWYEKNLIFPFSFAVLQRIESKINLEDIKKHQLGSVIQQKTIDVIIPTIGRKNTCTMF
jgi:hypothetical protein